MSDCRTGPRTVKVRFRADSGKATMPGHTLQGDRLTADPGAVLLHRSTRRKGLPYTGPGLPLARVSSVLLSVALLDIRSL
jgi:hypothetical protein